MPRTRNEDTAGDWIPPWLPSRGGGAILLVGGISCLTGVVVTVGLAASNPLFGRAPSTADLIPLFAGSSFGLAWTIVCGIYVGVDRLGRWFSPRLRRAERER